MADKQVTVAVPEERVPEFYVWFAAFLESRPGAGVPFGGRDRLARRGRRHDREPQAWSAQDADQAAWLYGKLAPPAQALFDLLIDASGQRYAGDDLARRLGLEKGAHGVAGILAWPGRYCRHLDRELPITTEGRPDGGTDYYMEPGIAELFRTARAQPPQRSPRGRRRRDSI